VWVSELVVASPVVTNFVIQRLQIAGIARRQTQTSDRVGTPMVVSPRLDARVVAVIGARL